MVLVMAVVVVLADQLSKFLIRLSLVEGATTPIIKNIFHITYVRNAGAAFGLFPDRPAFLVAVSATIVLAIIVYYFSYRPSKPVVRAALGLELGGAVGNLIDRLVNGRVTDFLEIRNVWPVFNLADSAIVAGAVLLAIALIFFSPDAPDERQAKSKAGD